MGYANVEYDFSANMPSTSSQNTPSGSEGVLKENAAKPMSR